MKGYKAIEEMAEKRGLVISCGSAAKWIGSLNKAEKWQQGDRVAAAKMHAYSYLYQGCWVEPNEAYPNLRSLREAVSAHIENREPRFYV